MTLKILLSSIVESLPDMGIFCGFLRVMSLFFGAEAFLLVFICLPVWFFFTRLIKGLSSELSSETPATQESQEEKLKNVIKESSNVAKFK